MILRKMFSVFATAAVFMTASLKVSAADITSLCTEPHGYGQGRQCDEDNRPLCASMFNEEFNQYDAYAMLDFSNDICLTFDQGYENGYTSSILDVLKDKGVKAIFFVTGDYARRNHELIERMIKEGHIIGNHGMKHASIPKLGIEKAKEEIMSLHDYVKKEYNYEMKYFRPPCGEYSEQSLAICQTLGYKTFLWSFAYPDWDVNNQPDTSAAFKRVSESLHGGAIYLFHSVSSTNAEILVGVIDDMKSKGYNLNIPQI